MNRIAASTTYPTSMLSSLAGVLFDGFAYGMLLFLLSVGLSVTLGMMNFVNLAHCSFAMVGGYATVALAGQARLAVPRHAAGGVRRRRGSRIVLERTLYRRLYRASDLDQCLLHHRHRLHLDRGFRLVLYHRAAVVAGAGVPARLGAGRAA